MTGTDGSADRPVDSGPGDRGRQIRISAAGLVVDLVFDEDLSDLSGDIAELWGHLRLPLTGQKADFCRSYRSACATGPHGVVAVPPGPEGSYAVSGDLTRQVIDRLAGKRLLLHAGAVELPGIGVMLLLGPSGAGKSTATVRLGVGGRYLTDELVVLDPATFMTTGYPKPISWVERTVDGEQKRDRPLEDFGLTAAAASAPPATILLLDRIREAGSSEPDGLHRLALEEAIPEIVAQTSALWMIPGGLEALARLLNRCGGAMRARYREAARLADLLDSVPPSRTGSFEVITARSAPAPPRADEIALAPFVQALVLDATVLVLREGELLTISSIGAVIWDRLHTYGAMRLKDIRRLVVADLGSHPDSGPLVRSAAQQLVRIGAVVSGSSGAWTDL